MTSKKSGPSFTSSTSKATKTVDMPAFKNLQRRAKPKISSPPTSIPPTPSSPVTSIKLQEMMDDYAEKIMLKVKQLTQELMQELKEEILEKVHETVMTLVGVIDDVAERVDIQEKKFDTMHERQEEMRDLQSEVTMLRFQQIEFALRVRNLPEENQEDLKVKVATSLAPVLGCEYEKTLEEIDCAYRVNSKIAIQRNLPRDVVIYFFRKACRNEIIWKYYQQRFQIANHDIILLKEIPSKILQKRKDFAFLTQEFKKRQISFRWNIPIRITVTFDNKCYRLNTLQEAKEFYAFMVNSERLSSSQFEGLGGLSKLFKDSLSIQGDKDPQMLEAREEETQMMTRAMYRKKFLKGK